MLDDVKLHLSEIKYTLHRMAETFVLRYLRQLRATSLKYSRGQVPSIFSRRTSRQQRTSTTLKRVLAVEADYRKREPLKKPTLAKRFEQCL